MQYNDKHLHTFISKVYTEKNVQMKQKLCMNMRKWVNQYRCFFSVVLQLSSIKSVAIHIHKKWSNENVLARIHEAKNNKVTGNTENRMVQRKVSTWTSCRRENVDQEVVCFSSAFRSLLHRACPCHRGRLCSPWNQDGTALQLCKSRCSSHGRNSTGYAN